MKVMEVTTLLYAHWRGSRSLHHDTRRRKVATIILLDTENRRKLLKGELFSLPCHNLLDFPEILYQRTVLLTVIPEGMTGQNMNHNKTADCLEAEELPGIILLKE